MTAKIFSRDDGYILIYLKLMNRNGKTYDGQIISLKYRLHINCWLLPITVNQLFIIFKYFIYEKHNYSGHF